MKKVIFIYIAILLVSCNDKPVQKPDNLLDQEVMENILYDMAILQATQSFKHKILLDKNVKASEYIYKKYAIDSATYFQNYKYYASDIKSFKKIYHNINKKIQENKKEIDSIVIGNKIELKEDGPTYIPQTK